MPDLVSHLMMGGIAAHPLRHRLEPILIITGALLPDIISKPVSIIAPSFFFATQISHTIFGAVLQVLIVSQLLRPAMRFKGAISLSVGVALHLGFDLCQGNLLGIYPPLFFPLSWTPVGFNLFSSMHWYYALAFSVILGLISFLLRFRAAKHGC